MLSARLVLRLVFCSGLLLLTGLVLSRALTSIGMMGILGAALLGARAGDWKRALAPGRRAWLWLTLPFWIMLGSGIYTENGEMLLGQLRIALPLLALPLAFALLPRLPRPLLYGWLYFFVLLLFGAGLAVLGNYALHFTEIQEALSRSKAIPCPHGDHIRFSLLLALATFAALYLWRRGFVLRYAWERRLLPALALLLALMLHVLAVRSGLLALYLGALVLILRWTLRKRRPLLGLALTAALLTAPIAAYYTVPGIHAKYHLMMHNFKVLRRGEIGGYSDTNRLLSYAVAWELGKRNPWWGLGMGDVRDEQERYYALHYPELRPIYPHNQFLLFYVGSGIIGLALFCMGFFAPLFYARYRNDGLFVAFFVLIASSFLTENTLSIAIGMGIYAFFGAALMRGAEEEG